MDSSLLQRTRNQLKTRVDALEYCPPPWFPNACRVFIHWLESSPYLRGILAPLEVEALEHKKAIVLEYSHADAVGDYTNYVQPFRIQSLESSAALFLATLRFIGTLNSEEFIHKGFKAKNVHILSVLSAGHTPKDWGREPTTIKESLYKVVALGLYHYIDEQIDTRNAILGLITKYKERCEWYRRKRLRDLAKNSPEDRVPPGEDALAMDFYEYLHEQGIDFYIESKSAHGEPDLIAPNVFGEKLVADVKYISPLSEEELSLTKEKLETTIRTRTRKTLAEGLHQIFTYRSDHNEPIGYLVVFVEIPRTICIDDAQNDDGFNCLRFDGKTIYYEFINISSPRNKNDKELTASRLGTMKVLRFTREELVKGMKEVNVETDQNERSTEA